MVLVQVAANHAQAVAMAIVPVIVMMDAGLPASLHVFTISAKHLGALLHNAPILTQCNMRTKTITFIVTKSCQLACKYCYLVGKNDSEKMSFETAKRAVDYILSDREMFDEDAVTFEFIGGEPCLEIELIDKICDYIKTELYRLSHPWFNSYMFGFTTNGINYSSPKVQQFIQKNWNHLSITITIDGTKTKHDLNRIYKNNGRGSYDDVVKNIPIWLKQFPHASTKVTVSSEDIPYICESVVHLFELGIHQVHINCVFEDVWKDGDDNLLEEQLVKLADIIIGKEYYKAYDCSFFREDIGKPLDMKHNNNWCGAGRMLSIDASGTFYPCTRFVQYSLRSKKQWVIGNIHSGINKNLLRPFIALNRFTQSTDTCFNCEIASGCAWCQGENYDSADTPTIYQRSTAICKMHKARVRANNYFWRRLFNKMDAEGETRDSLSISNTCDTLC